MERELAAQIEEARAAADRHAGLLVETAASLVRLPSVNPDDGELAIAQYAKAWLERHADADVVVAAKVDSRPNLIAHVEGSGPGPTLMLSGHLDTKPIDDPDKWLQDPFSGVVAEGRLHGRGATDMKGGVAAILVAAKAIRELEGWPGRLMVVLTSDEEAGGHLGARYLCEEWGLSADAGLIAEPVGVDHPFEMIALACRGGCWLETIIEGSGGHSSLSDRLGMRNPNHAIGAVIAGLIEGFKVRPAIPHPLYPGGLTYNIGVKVGGGNGPGSVPDHCTIVSDVRLPPGVRREEVEDALRVYQAAAPRGATTRITKFGAGVASDSSEAIAVATKVVAAQVLGREVPFGGYPAGTDAVHFIGLGGIPCVTAFGPGFLRDAHVANESVAVSELLQASQLYAATAVTFLRGSAT